MYEQNKENGSQEPSKMIEISWYKVSGWVALMLSTMVPIASIGAAITCLSLKTETDSDEGKILSIISLAISAFMLFNEFVTTIVTI